MSDDIEDQEQSINTNKQERNNQSIYTVLSQIKYIVFDCVSF